MVFNNELCRNLTPDYVNQASPADLHRFAWVPDAQIKSLPLEWNWLIGEYEHNSAAKILHWTLGGPWFQETETTDYAAIWQEEKEHMLHGHVQTDFVSR